MIRLLTLVIGQVLSTGPVVTGTFPVENTEGRVEACQVHSGHVSFCRDSYTGDAVLPRGERHKYVSCQVSSGHVTRCSSTGYSGKIALQEGAGPED